MKKIISLVICVLTLCLVACKKNDEKTIIVGASITPHAEILEECREYIESKGYKLKIVEYTDYVLPNVGVNDGSLDANFFQHKPYLDKYNESNKTNLVSVCKIHYEPLGLYGGKKSVLTGISQNDTIAIPNDSTNRARALHLLKNLGLIQLDTGKGILATTKDITENKYNLKIVELEAAQIPLQLNSFDYGIVNGNYALNSNIISKLISSENSDSIGATYYANILCVKDANKDSEKTKILIEALTQDKIRDFINEKYKGIVIPVF